MSVETSWDLTNIMSYQGRADQNKNGGDHCKHQNLQLQLHDSNVNSCLIKFIIQSVQAK